MNALTTPTAQNPPALRDPFSIFEELRHKLEDLMLGHQHPSAWRPAIEVDEDEQGYTVTMAVPGWAEQDVTVEVDRNLLTIRGQRDATHHDDTRETGRSGPVAPTPHDRDETTRQKNRRTGDRWSGTFIQSLSLPPNIDSERITARLERGLLTVDLPKIPQAQPRRIPISGATMGREPAGG